MMGVRGPDLALSDPDSSLSKATPEMQQARLGEGIVVSAQALPGDTVVPAPRYHHVPPATWAAFIFSILLQASRSIWAFAWKATEGMLPQLLLTSPLAHLTLVILEPPLLGSSYLLLGSMGTLGSLKMVHIVTLLPPLPLSLHWQLLVPSPFHSTQGTMLWPNFAAWSSLSTWNILEGLAASTGSTACDPDMPDLHFPSLRLAGCSQAPSA